MVFSLLCPWSALAAPTGGQVVSGSATISQSGATTNINQSTNSAIINWLGFSIAPSETVNFYQPSSSSMTLNRVIGNEASIIAGALNANGKVYIVNANGILFTSSASVNTGGLVASTLGITDANFNAGNFVFQGTGQLGQVINMGTIKVTGGGAGGGYVALLGDQAINEGVIIADKGTVSLNGAQKVTLNFNGDSLVSVTLDEGSLNALVESKNAIIADGGKVILTAKAANELVTSQVNVSGIVQARTLADLSGGIEVYAHGGTANVSGTLDASAPNGGNGGAIETSGNTVKIADSAVITTKAPYGISGTWLIDPVDFTIAATGGDMTGAALGTQLLNNALVTIRSSQGASGTNGDINVNDSVTWADSALVLAAVRNIKINAPLTITGATGSLALNYGGYDGVSVLTPTAGTGYSLRTKASYSGVNVVTPAADAVGAGLSTAMADTSGGVYGSITYTNAANTSGLSVNGQTYTLLHSMADLAAINNITGKYALAQNLTSTGTYAGPVVGTLASSSVLTGLGHSISNLTINTDIASNTSGISNIGLIGTLGSGGSIRDLGLINTNITVPNALYNNNIGTLVGNTAGTASFSNVYSEGGSITAPMSQYVGGLVGGNAFGSAVTIDSSYTKNLVITGLQSVGGLAGSLYNGSSISNSHSEGGSVTSATSGSSGYSLGGLVGNMKGNVSSSWSSTKVTGNYYVGGLIGNWAGVLGKTYSVTDSFATGDVTGTRMVGGLIGRMTTSAGATYYPFTLSNSYATGDVYAIQDLIGSSGVHSIDFGGLVGLAENGFNISHVHATGDVAIPVLTGSLTLATFTPPDRVGGLIGEMNGKSSGTPASTLTYAYASGDVGSSKVDLSYSEWTGGLVGTASNIAEISDVYALGNVAGGRFVGGLIGSYGSSVTSVIKNAYSDGSVVSSGDATTGALIGNLSNPSNVTVSNSYWNADNNNGAWTGSGTNAPSSVSGLSGVRQNDSEIINNVMQGKDPNTVLNQRVQAAQQSTMTQATQAASGQQASAVETPAAVAQAGTAPTQPVSLAEAIRDFGSQSGGSGGGGGSFRAGVKTISADGVTYTVEEDGPTGGGGDGGKAKPEQNAQ